MDIACQAVRFETALSNEQRSKEQDMHSSDTLKRCTQETRMQLVDVPLRHCDSGGHCRRRSEQSRQYTGVIDARTSIRSASKSGYSGPVALPAESLGPVKLGASR
jgi:secreted trypsin-like serine protease